MRILVLGANGMLGNACMSYLASNPVFEVIGTLRSESSLGYFSPQIQKQILTGVDIADELIQSALLRTERPDVVINCIGIVKQVKDGNDSKKLMKLNADLPHQLARQCSEYGVRMLQISTDCVFSGLKGAPYLLTDKPDPVDLYGKSKYLGEIVGVSNILTLRTSYIGNELQGANGLLEWFLAQDDQCQGFTRAIYSGMPTVILVRVIENVLFNFPRLSGLYQVASNPISKYNLLKLIAQVFQKSIHVAPNDSVVIDRSLDGSLFQEATGFVAPSWEVMVEKMYLDRIANVQK
jgi:dTDP-4-dehydrorhamnose reductase